MKSTTPNRRDAYMGAMNKTEKPRSSMSTSDPKSKPQPSKMAPAKSPRPVGKPSPNRGNTNPETSAPERSTPAPSSMVPSKLAPAKSPRPVAAPKKKQATYPGRKPYNYAV